MARTRIAVSFAYVERNHPGALEALDDWARAEGRASFAEAYEDTDMVLYEQGGWLYLECDGLLFAWLCGSWTDCSCALQAA